MRGEAVIDTAIGCGSLCHFFTFRARHYWRTWERKGENCFSVHQLGLRYSLLYMSTLFFSAFLSHTEFMGGTETINSATDPHFLPEFLSLVISSSEAEYVLVYEKQGQGALRYRC